MLQSCMNVPRRVQATGVDLNPRRPQLLDLDEHAAEETVKDVAKQGLYTSNSLSRR